ncbi:MAG: spermidine/putrescine ABC transporter substrate-binding protein [Cyanobacteria bacterium SZAS LIN-3]|nr:spermidine/putrescine ABC transporter substrate-binding protein [Cyanobacteria bacterium SZAS LIN-3]MBS2007101.1 spermidine/putrescine ABC transporter substrate-binding protein [Cyanobacteria bacterium SZAS TMP-1]
MPLPAEEIEAEKQGTVLSRRSFIGSALGTAIGGACTFLLGGCAAGTDDGERQVNILNWADYLHPDAISEFERRYKIRVVQDTFASNEALLAKLQAGGTRYDVIVPSSYMVKQLKKLDILSALEHDRIKGLDNLLPRFQSTNYDPGLHVSVPYTWGTTGIGFNLDEMERIRGAAARTSDRAGGLELSWDILWDRAFKGRLTMLEDAREVIGTALKMQGHSYNTREHSLIKSATDLLKEQKQLVMCYTSDQVIVELASGDSFLSQVYSGDCYQARRENTKLRYAIPTDGCSIWTDNFCIPKTAPHREFAYLWISYMLEPDVAAACANFTHYATANEKAFKKVQPELASDPHLYPGEKVLARCEDIGDVGEALFYYDRMWTELKCS